MVLQGQDPEGRIHSATHLASPSRGHSAWHVAHLHVALRLHEAAHDAEHGVQLLVARLLAQRRCGGRDDRVERPLPGRQAVGVRRIQDEVGAPVLCSVVRSVKQSHCSRPKETESS